MGQCVANPNCDPPGKVLDSGASRQAFGELVERIVQRDYCRALAAAGGCAPFFPAGLGGARTEFFDEDAGVHRCDQLANYLAFHNPAVNPAPIIANCLATNPKPLLVKVPDIISHRMMRTEFYEIKPNSRSGIKAGAEKIAWFNVLCSPPPAGFSLPYVAGNQYKPDFTVALSIGNSLGAPFQIGIHVCWALEGLLLWEICPVTNRQRQGDKCTALERAGALAAIIRLRADANASEATYNSLVAAAVSPLQGAVGNPGPADPAPNIPSDALYVQLLLNDWRGQNGLALIGEDGLVGPETLGAIRAFQQAVTGIVDGRIDPGGPAIGALERNHILAALRAVEPAIAQDPLPDVTDSTIFHEDDEDDPDEPTGVAEDPVTPDVLLAAMQGEMATYLQILYA